jgi:phenylacetic acid degradation operon negative regulatory protein
MISSMPHPLPPRLTSSVETLVGKFRRQRPIRGGSLLITIFGDAIAPRGGAITLGSLISLAQPFGLTERLVRTSVARLAGDEWLVARRDGRRSEYRLTAAGRNRFAEATRRIYGEIPRTWDGQWTLLILPPGIGGRPQDVRDELRWLGFGQVSPGVFAHPNWSVEQARNGISGLKGAGDGLLLKSASEDRDINRRLVAAGWDLGDLTRRYRRFVDTFTPVAEAVVSTTGHASTTPPATGRSTKAAASITAASITAATLPNSATPCALDPRSTTDSKSAHPDESAFIIRTLLIHEYRKIHLQDPLLPPALLPSDWVGAAAYDLTKKLYSAVFAAAERYLSNTASTTTEPLPTADESAYARFGGLPHVSAAPPPQ